MSHSAMSIAEYASVKIPPGPAELPAASRSFWPIASTRSGSSPTVSAPSSSTACFSVPVSAAPKNVTPMPSMPASVATSRVTNSRNGAGNGAPPASGSSAGSLTRCDWLRVIFTARVPT